MVTREDEDAPAARRTFPHEQLLRTRPRVDPRALRRVDRARLPGRGRARGAAARARAPPTRGRRAAPGRARRRARHPAPPRRSPRSCSGWPAFVAFQPLGARGQRRPAQRVLRGAVRRSSASACTSADGRRVAAGVALGVRRERHRATARLLSRAPSWTSSPAGSSSPAARSCSAASSARARTSTRRCAPRRPAAPGARRQAEQAAARRAQPDRRRAA